MSEEKKDIEIWDLIPSSDTPLHQEEPFQESFVLRRNTQFPSFSSGKKSKTQIGSGKDGEDGFNFRREEKTNITRSLVGDNKERKEERRKEGRTE